MDTAARIQECDPEPVLHMAMELSARKRKRGFTVGLGQKPRQRTIDAGDLGALREAIERAYKRFKLPESTRVVSCYEASREGFWIHRCLEKVGIRSVEIDPANGGHGGTI
jgi:transposase